jgi:hypothetical protein
MNFTTCPNRDLADAGYCRRPATHLFWPVSGHADAAPGAAVGRPARCYSAALEKVIEQLQQLGPDPIREVSGLRTIMRDCRVSSHCERGSWLPLFEKRDQVKKEDEHHSTDEIEVTPAMISAAEAIAFDALCAPESGGFLGEETVSFMIREALRAGGFLVRAIPPDA